MKDFKLLYEFKNLKEEVLTVNKSMEKSHQSSRHEKESNENLKSKNYSIWNLKINGGLKKKTWDCRRKGW